MSDSTIEFEFDVAEGERRKEEAIARVERAAKEDFKAAALACVFEISGEVPAFTTDRVWWLLRQRGVTPPRERRALGPVMRRAQSLGWIEPTDEFHLCARASRHRAPLRVWRSIGRVE